MFQGGRWGLELRDRLGFGDRSLGEFGDYGLGFRGLEGSRGLGLWGLEFRGRLGLRDRSLGSSGLWVLGLGDRSVGEFRA